MGTEDWVLNGTKFIRNTKKHRLKIQSRVWNFKNTILKKRRRRRRKKKQSHKNYLKKKIYEVCFKNRVFFLQGNSCYKNEKLDLN